MFSKLQSCFRNSSQNTNEQGWKDIYRDRHTDRQFYVVQKYVNPLLIIFELILAAVRVCTSFSSFRRAVVRAFVIGDAFTLDMGFRGVNRLYKQARYIQLAASMHSRCGRRDARIHAWCKEVLRSLETKTSYLSSSTVFCAFWSQQRATSAAPETSIHTLQIYATPSFSNTRCLHFQTEGS